MSEKSIAIITARGGSKRIPRKNIREFLGKPIIAYTIDAALKSNCFDEVMVSTDDDEIAEISMSYGALVPFRRSAANSDDHATTADVLTEVIETYRKNERNFDYGCCLYPTAPFVTPSMLRDGYEMLVSNGVSTVVPVVAFSPPIWRALKIEANKLVGVFPEKLQMRSQDLQETFYDAGQFYWFNVADFINSKNILTSNSKPLVVSSHLIQDVDTEDDWRMAELKYQLLQALKSKAPKVYNRQMS